jgi:manganese transport protein
MKLALMGPAFIAAIGYIDPGNFATNIQAGASFGYQLLWVVVWANLMAMLIQVLSAKLGIATGKNLAEQIRDHYPRPVVWFYWVQAEIIAMATDLAEFIGAAIGFKLVLACRCCRGGADRDCDLPDPDAAASRSKAAGKSDRRAAAVCRGGLCR